MAFMTCVNCLRSVKLLYWIGFRNSDRAKFRKEWLCEKRYRNNSGAIKANVAI